MIDAAGHRWTRQDAARTVAQGAVLVGLLTDGLPGAPDLSGSVAATQRLADDEAGPLDVRLTALLDVWGAAAEEVRSSGVLGPPASGTVEHLAVSDGGVPKRSVERVEVDATGVVGDVQAARAHHGRPWQALCLWGSEVIDDLRGQGHPIGPGLAGENITLSGLPWGRVRPGATLRIGSVACEVSAYAVPCRKNAQWFSDRRFNRIHHSKGPVSRVYAWVREPGAIAVGDTATLTP